MCCGGIDFGGGFVRSTGGGGERTVKKLRLSKALTIPEGTTVFEACRRMASRRVDAVLLTDTNALLSGILTDKVCSGMMLLLFTHFLVFSFSFLLILVLQVRFFGDGALGRRYQGYSGGTETRADCCIENYDTESHFCYFRFTCY